VKTSALSAVIVAAIWLATLAGSALGAAPTPTADQNAASAGSDDSASAGDSGQTLEIPPAAPNAASPSDSSASSGGPSSYWSDGSNTYRWKDESDGAEPAPPPQQPQDGPQPSYAGVDDYMNQELQTEAMGPAFTPFFGAPLLASPYASAYAYPGLSPFAYGGYYYSPYRYTVPAPIPPPVALPPPRIVTPPPPVVSHNVHHFMPLPHFRGR
jgi:hypothetical protein